MTHQHRARFFDGLRARIHLSPDVCRAVVALAEECENPNAHHTVNAALADEAFRLSEEQGIDYRTALRQADQAREELVRK